MINFDDVSLGLSIAGFLVCLSDLLFTMMDKRFGKPQNKIYIFMIILLAVNAGCGIVAFISEKNKLVSDTAFHTLEVSRYIYFLTHSLLAPIFFFYISFVIGRSVSWKVRYAQYKHKPTFLFDVLMGIALLVMMLMIIFNPLLHWMWIFDESRDFQRLWGEMLIYIQSALWLTASFVLVMRSWNILSQSRKYSLAVCYFLVVTGILIQLFFSNFYMEVLMEALAFTGVLIFVENEDDRRDVKLDVYNSAAFSLDISALLKNKIPVRLIIVRDIRFNRNANLMLYGKIDSSSLLRKVAEYLGTKVKKYDVYTIGHHVFAVTLYDRSEEAVRQTAQEIADRFRNPWNMNQTDVFLKASVMIVGLPERASTIADILYMAECPIPEKFRKPVMQGEDLDWIIRYAAVEAAVTRGLEEGSFEVYYQPTYHINKHPYGAEALLRMHDHELGNIYPDEFIPIAEKLGLIDEIDDFVLEQVCRLLSTGVPQQYGIGHINVNLSVLECMKDGFADHIIRIVEASGVDKHHISFEITESVAAKDYRHLEEVIEKLKSVGFMFYIDDFGTGYSNINALFSLDADVIKIDKSVLWGAEKSERGMVLLPTLPLT
ncbi:MAG: EAL domain-containing protein [Oscillospiraceae bacterium]|nr:EAL domain-containing protein [Oscillospiraceae bacterium]